MKDFDVFIHYSVVYSWPKNRGQQVLPFRKPCFIQDKSCFTMIYRLPFWNPDSPKNNSLKIEHLNTKNNGQKMGTKWYVISLN